MIVTLEQAKDHLRVTHDSDDNDITLKIHGASAAIINYLKSSADSFLDSSGEVVLDSSALPVVPFVVIQATLLMVGWMYNFREGEDKAFVPGYLPAPIISLLFPLRDPALS